MRWKPRKSFRADLYYRLTVLPVRVPPPPEGIDLKQLERDLVRQALLRASGNRSQAARLLGLSRRQLRYRLEKLERESPVS